ncbi:MAG: low molecular weight phosphotyrosine protein phosphatase [Balneolaceae bacterium]|nr:low molecular weight phosphotyrosine protein phosphatase [Balneolaceae bacterium]MBO6545224.1 low molecular weight phosphotyrosine protein phosphatase [Balneolaceae bacterium]MBO6646620.1 low molecular weight phosphotyrosine protein phosphatase [Balneolaceae bacterium]
MENYLREITQENPYKLVFVCLGNICRSTTGEGVFIYKVKEAGLESYFYIDSAGTAAYHTGERADRRSQETANGHGVHLPSIARRFEYADLEEFDLILAMDSSNLTNINQLDRKGKFANKVKLLREFDPEPGNKEVPDPYYGGQNGFENVFKMIDRSCKALLEELKPHIQN